MTHIPPFWESVDFWVAFLVAAVGGGGLGGIVTAIMGRRRAMAERDNLAADAARKAVDILTVDVITPLREEAARERGRADRLNHRVCVLEEEEQTYLAAIRYIRSLCHWLDPAVTAIDPVYMSAHPKPRLPDELRAFVAPESMQQQQAQIGGGNDDAGD